LVVVKRIDSSIDLTRPAEEIIDTIIMVLSFYSGRQQEILQQVDHTVGEMLAAMQPNKDPGPAEKTEDSP
jgi:hypothetical protein